MPGFRGLGEAEFHLFVRLDKSCGWLAGESMIVLRLPNVPGKSYVWSLKG